MNVDVEVKVWLKKYNVSTAAVESFFRRVYYSGEGHYTYAR